MSALQPRTPYGAALLAKNEVRRLTSAATRIFPVNFPVEYATVWLHIAKVDAVFKALADGSRRKLLDRLYRSDGQTLTQLCEQLDMTRQAVTKHLALLERANLISVVWRGREKLHYLNPVPLHEIYERWISKYERHRLQALSDLKKGLEEHKRR